MLFLNQFNLNIWEYGLIDSVLLVLLLFPALYFAFFKPFRKVLSVYHEAEKSIRKSEERYKTIFENVQDVYYEVNATGTILEVSPSIREFSKGQYTREELIGTSVYALYNDTHMRDVLFELIKVTGELRDYEITLKNKDGSILQCSLSSRLFFTETGIPSKIIGMMRDISARKEIEQNIKQKNEELRVINSEKDKFFSIIAHDLRSPFNAFIGLTELMSRKAKNMNADEMQQFAVTINSSALNLYSLLENLLLWAGNQQGTVPFNPQWMVIKPHLNRAIADLKQAAHSKEISVSVQINDKLKMYADENAFQTIIRNLLSNSIKFTCRGGSIALSARSIDQKRIEISCEDTGIGMDARIMERLFKIDNKINRLGTEGELSSGLGLLLCKDFVEKHGGSISVSSEPGKGSNFTFII
ncbi:MAG TPA: PAS domain-containing sensor histidine kinase [Bacteroidales bacterium]|nr:PAS domain-containing sensor histidine kinase [Bacteroidales bacterium]